MAETKKLVTSSNKIYQNVECPVLHWCLWDDMLIESLKNAMLLLDELHTALWGHLGVCLNTGAFLSMHTQQMNRLQVHMPRHLYASWLTATTSLVWLDDTEQTQILFHIQFLLNKAKLQLNQRHISRSWSLPECVMRLAHFWNPNWKNALKLSNLFKGLDGYFSPVTQLKTGTLIIYTGSILYTPFMEIDHIVMLSE